MDKKDTRIYINRTEAEWQQIDQEVEKMLNGRADFYSYVRGSMYALHKNYNKCQPCVTIADGEKITRSISLEDKNIYDTINTIASKMKCAKNQVVDRLIIQPLLNNKDK